MAASMYTCCQRLAVVCKTQTTALLSIRNYARGIKRTPIAAISPEEDLMKIKDKGFIVKDPRMDPSLPFIPGDPTQSQFIKSEKTNKNKLEQKDVKSVTHNSRNFNKQSNSRTLQQYGHNQKGWQKKRLQLKNGLSYEFLEDGDKRFGQVILSTKSRKERERKGRILLEGKRLIQDSLEAGLQMKCLYFSDPELASGLPADLIGKADLYRVQYRHLKLWADTDTPSGILGVFTKPETGQVVSPQESYVPLTLICDNIRDPGNLGTLIRTAAAAGCKRIITTKGCVDVWDPKVLRGAMGGHFYTSVHSCLPWDQVAALVTPLTQVFVADTRQSRLVEGSFEPMHPKVMELISTETHEKHDGDADSDSDSERGEDNPHAWSRKNSATYQGAPLSVTEYSALDLQGASEAAVIIGGETHGVGNQAAKFAFDRQATVATVPMAKSVDSLNTAVAAALVLYEARRQLLASCVGVQEKWSHSNV